MITDICFTFRPNNKIVVIIFHCLFLLLTIQTNQLVKWIQHAIVHRHDKFQSVI